MNRNDYKPDYLRFLFIVLLILVLDQLSKNFMVLYFQSSILRDAYLIKITSFFNLILNWNRGVTFGMFDNIESASVMISILVALIIIALIVWYSKSSNPDLLVPLSMIVSGAFGNLIDRLRYGAVVDFLDFHLVGYHYPAFNIADSSIVIGSLIMLYLDFKRGKMHVN